MKKLLPIILLFVSQLATQAQNLRQISNLDGLTSSAVMCVYQTRDGMVWMGTCDGLNYYYGQNVKQVHFADGKDTFGYMVEDIVQTDNGDLWFQTPHGLYRIDRILRTAQRFDQFDGSYYLRPTDGTSVCVFDRQEQLYRYIPETARFEQIDYQPDADEMLVDIGMVGEYLFTAGNRGIARYRMHLDGSGRYHLDRREQLFDTPVLFAAQAREPLQLYIIDERGALYRLNLTTNEQTFLLDAALDIAYRGMPSAVVELNGYCFISFKTDGVIRYRILSDNKVERVDIGIKTGVFGMIRDRHQPILWIATDGAGLFAYWDGIYSISSYQNKDYDTQLGKPVRSLFVDDRNHLWVGTKGDGLLEFDRGPIFGSYRLRQVATTSNSQLTDNSVYALAPSRHGGFWIGTEEGLNFYDYRTRTLQRVAADERIKYIHAISETDEATLWLATVGNGIFKAQVMRRGAGLALEQPTNYSIENGNFSSNFFFAMRRGANGDMWFGNRGYGVFRMSQGGMQVGQWANNGYGSDGGESPLRNDIFDLIEADSILWTGTNCGLIGLDMRGGEIRIDRSNGLPNNIVHTMLPDNDGGLWVATNAGLAKVGRDRRVTACFDNNNGLLVTEFSDAASLLHDGVRYFGGNNGWVEVQQGNIGQLPTDSDAPIVQFTRFQTAEEEIDLWAEIDRTRKPDEWKPDGPQVVSIPHDAGALSIEFVVLDYIGPKNYDYQYRLHTPSDDGSWVDNHNVSHLTLARLEPGTYLLDIKCRNRFSGLESEPKSLRIVVRAPWWGTLTAKLIYLLLGLGLCGLVFRLLTEAGRRRQRAAMEAVERRHRDELYEEKLRFFTNITHEFCTPLTLIFNPCERILAYDRTDPYVAHYTQMIQKNAEHINTLIQEIIDYRRIETRSEEPRIAQWNVSDLCTDVFQQFADVAAQNDIVLENSINSGILWNTDVRFFRSILTNLVSNALKYTPKNGHARISLATDSGMLMLRVYNTGKGIAEKDRERIFNRYSILDNVEGKAKKGLSSRNGLGLAICYSMVKLLQGTIQVNSLVDNYAEFVVKLPLLPITEEAAEHMAHFHPPVVTPPEETAMRPLPIQSSAEDDLLPPAKDRNDERASILVVDDNEEILFLLRDTLSDYDVRTATDATRALELLRQEQPQLIITDVMMPGTDGLALTKQIKEDQYLSHIPLIILSARNSDSEKIEGLMSGADAYITKPFSVNYLLAVIHSLVAQHRRTHAYYNSVTCAFEYTEGQLLKEEDRAFVHRIDDYVARHLRSNDDLSIEELAEHLQISTRSMYRRFKELNLPSPKDLLREAKITYAARLLLVSQKTIQEIIYECGFNNRAHFYKAFSKRYGMTPGEYRSSAKQQEEQ